MPQVSSAPEAPGHLAVPAGDPVPFAALDRQNAALSRELTLAFDRVVGRSAFVLGEEVECFEAEFASSCGVQSCLGVASGTAALALALEAAGVGPGDEVIVPAHTFIASALAVVHAGATPVFCDVEPGSGLIDPASAAAVVSARTAAVVAVHLYGQACDMDAVREFAARHHLLVVEDAAQAHGATFRGRSVGSLGDVAAFSFYPTKNLGALGDGGAICTDDDEIAARCRRLRNLGQRRKGEHIELGRNERLDGLQAAFLRAKLPYVGVWNRARREHAAAYRAGIETMRHLDERDHTPSVYHLYPVRVARRDETRAHLAARGVETAVHYAPAAHRHRAWEGVLAESRIELPAADAWAREELSLPMFAELERREVDRVIQECAGLPSELTDPDAAGGRR